MPRKSSEGDKKHGDKLESLVQRTAEGQQAEDEDDPRLLQDDDDESAENDDADDRRDVPN